MPKPLPPATLSIDLDNLWTYQRSFGNPEWQQYPSFLTQSIPRLVSLLETQGLRLTAFIVGYDAAQPENHDCLHRLSAGANELGNHSFLHKPSFHTEQCTDIETELAQTEAAIQAATGELPQGFRGPAFCTSPQLLTALAKRGYLYDASSFPTSIGPLARAYQHFKSGLDKQEKQKQARLYGGFSNAFGSLKPFYWQLEDNSPEHNQEKRRLIALPVTTMPFTRLPIHMTYINYIADRSPQLAKGYFKLALNLCRRRNVAPSLLLHATDFMGCDDAFDLSFIPGMRRSAADKIDLMTELLEDCRHYYEMMPLSEFAKRLKQSGELPHLPVGTC